MIEKQPTLLIGEAAFILLACVALIHAFANGRQHVLLWFGALIGGCCNDVFFMVLPFVDNFWHAQCYLMLTPRLPAYILCVYIAFIYVPVAASWRSWAHTRASASSRARRSVARAARLGQVRERHLRELLQLRD